MGEKTSKGKNIPIQVIRYPHIFPPFEKGGLGGIYRDATNIHRF